MTTGRTVEEAKDSALDELGVDEVDAEFEIIEEPRQGLFGRQRGQARVRARVRPTAPRPKTERRDRKRRVDREKGANGRPGSDKPATVPSEGTPPLETESSVPDEEDLPGAVGRGPKRAPGRGGDARQQAGAPSGDHQHAATGSQPVVSTDEGMAVSEQTEQEDALTLAEQGQIAQTFVTGLLAEFGVVAQVGVAEIEEDTLEVQVTGQELGLLIGPKGQTLAAVQELARTVVQRRTPGRTGRLVVDVAGYRQRRREALEHFTQQVAADVVASGTQRVLEPMTAADRKVVHDTANDIAGVRTVSEGEDPRRRVVILPA